MTGLFNSRAFRVLAGIAAVAFVTSCAGHGTTPKTSFAIPTTPQSVSPAQIPVAPMAKTEIQPASEMNAIKPMDSIEPSNFQPIPGTATYSAASRDGSLWVLSDQPAGPDKYIWHYVNGLWTNIGGLASRIAVASDPNTFYVINSGGGVYQYNVGAKTFTPLGGGASDVTVGVDNTVYVLSNGSPAGTDQAIWHYVAGAWTQVPGSGVRITGNWDTQNYNVAGGTIASNGFYIVNSAGNIYYENATGTFVSLPGQASIIVPTFNAGFFALSYPASASGNTIFYYDLDAQAYSTPGGSAVQISTDTISLYAIGAAGGIYYSLLKTHGSIPVTFANNSGITPAYFTLVGNNPLDRFDPAFYHVTASGQLVQVARADVGADGTADYNIPFPAAGTPFNVPLIRAGRMYISVGAKFKTPVNSDLTVAGANGWSDAKNPDFNIMFDDFEFDYVVSRDSGQPGLGLNTTQVDMFGLPLSFTLTGPTTGTNTAGFKPGAFTQIMDGLAADPTFKTLLVPGTVPGTSITNLRAVSANIAIQNTLDNNPGVPHFANATYYDNYIASVWNQYKNQAFTFYSSAFGTYTGAVNGNNQFVFSQPNKLNLVFSLPSTNDVIIGNGKLVTPCQDPHLPADQAAACGEIGSSLSAGFNRGTLLERGAF